MIIDHLHDCKSSLQSCALVSRTWLPASRFHLFRSIELGTQYDTYSPLRKIYTSIQKSPHILALIRELHIHEGNMDKGLEWVNDAPDLALLLNSLTHLNTLHLRRINWILLTPKLRGAFRRLFASNPISNFVFEKCDFPFSLLLSILSTCSASISLTLLHSQVVSSDFRPERFKTVEKEESRHVGLWNKCRFHDIRIIGGAGLSKVKSWLNLNDPESGPDLSHLHTLYCDYTRVRLGDHLQHLCLNASCALLCVSIPSLSLIVLHSHCL
jgi:hypothetical protein